MTKHSHWNQKFKSHKEQPFYGCINSKGEWFDSSELFATAVHWCAMYYGGKYNLTTEEELLWMDSEGQEHGLSILHSSMLERLVKAGIIK